jgi:hypothetical protein
MTERPLIIEMIRAEAQEYHQRAIKANKGTMVPDPEPGRGLFTVYTGNQWLELEATRPMPKMLFGEFWYQGELCILFADTNAGKSVLAVQVGNCLSRAEPIGPFAVQAEPANVLYIDFELTGKQFQLRYTGPDGRFDHRDFGRNFYRAEFNPNADMPPDFKSIDEYINCALEHYIKKTGADVVIIDNITCLRQGTERAADALPLMKHLKALKTQYNLSVLVLAHTPKRNPGKALTVNCLQGSKMLINFADSAFAIGSSVTHKDVKYLKQIKQRNTTQQYGEDKVCIARLKKYEGFLHFEFNGYAREQQHLRQNTPDSRAQVARQVRELNQQGRSQRQIAAEMQLSIGAVNKILKQGASAILSQLEVKCL